MARKNRTLFLASLGCVKNRVDSEVMLGVANRAGYRIVSDPSLATTIVVNTCGFIGDAKTESLDTILEMAAHKKAGTCDRLIVAGCLSQRHPAELSLELEEVDHFLGTSDVPGFERILRGGGPRTAVGDPAGWLMRSTDPRLRTTGKASAYVKIAEGCSRTCSFCIIPKLRGKQRSRPADDIVREVEMLAADGVLEINLVAQDTVAYGRDLAGRAAADLCSLARRVADVPGIRWVRLLYLYPENLPPALLALLGQHPRVVPYVDMPLQHVSDAMLKRMRRGHGGARIRTLVERLRQKIPGLVFRTAFIVGHPGETAADFRELCDFVRWARFDRLAAFRYSGEEGTASRAMAAAVRARTAQARYDELLSIQQQISFEKNLELVGRNVDILVEGPSDEHDHVMMGRHAGQAPEIDGQVYLSGGEADAGTMVRVQITQASEYDLVGEIVTPSPRRRTRLRVLPPTHG
jgi:ribosomal protein S12 methylthiotransferase